MKSKTNKIDITILGTRGEIEASAPYHSRHSGVLIDNTLLFDLGEPEFLAHKPRAIFITHLHPDHAYFVRSGTMFPQTNIPIYAPESYESTPLKICTQPVRIDNYLITPIPTEHSIHVRSQAYLIEKNDLAILYTGDLFWINQKYKALLKPLSLVITEASSHKKGGLIRRHPHTDAVYGHAGIPDLIHMFKPFSKHILFMHFGSWFYTTGAQKARRLIFKIARQEKIKAMIGYDGMRISLKK